MFGPLGFPELIFLLVLALLVFGPKKLPEIGRTLGKGLAEFRKASNELKRTINAEMEEIQEADPRRLLRDEPPHRPATKNDPSRPTSPEPIDAEGRVARGEPAEPVTTEQLTTEPVTTEPIATGEATAATVAETP